MTLKPPVNPPDAGWLGVQSVADLRESAAADADAPVGKRWLAECAAWLSRVAGRGALPGLPPHAVAFPACADGGLGGAIGWVEAALVYDVATPAPHAPAKLLDAAQVAAELAAAVMTETAVGAQRRSVRPAVRLHARRIDGPSVGLAALLSAVAHLVGEPVPGDVIATGCASRAQDGRVRLEPAHGIDAKLAVAAEWNFRRMLVIKGTAAHEPTPLEVIEISADPAEAVVDLLALFDLASAGEAAQLAALTLIDLNLVRGGGPPGRPDEVLARVAPFAADARPVRVRRYAHDVLSRVHLHAGRAEEARRELDVSRAVQTSPPAPVGWASEYLGDHQPSHAAVVYLDNLEWDDDAFYADLDRTIVRLRDDPNLPVNRMMALLFALNTRAMRHLFRGRWHRNVELLRAAWSDLTELREHWPVLIGHAERINLLDTTLRRQHNNLIACAWSLHDLLAGPAEPFDGSRLGIGDLSNMGLWTDGLRALADHEKTDCYDRAAWLRWRSMTGPKPTDGDVRAALDGLPPEGAYYPATLVFEQVLWHNLGTSAQSQAAGDALAASGLFGDRVSHGVEALLSRRAAAILARHGRSIEPLPVKPSGLPARFRNDLECDEVNIISRCPY